MNKPFYRTRCIFALLLPIIMVGTNTCNRRKSVPDNIKKPTASDQPAASGHSPLGNQSPLQLAGKPPKIEREIWEKTELLPVSNKQSRSPDGPKPSSPEAPQQDQILNSNANNSAGGTNNNQSQLENQPTNTSLGGLPITGKPTKEAGSQLKAENEPNSNYFTTFKQLVTYFLNSNGQITIQKTALESTNFIQQLKALAELFNLQLSDLNRELNRFAFDSIVLFKSRTQVLTIRSPSEQRIQIDDASTTLIFHRHFGITAVSPNKIELFGIELHSPNLSGPIKQLVFKTEKTCFFEVDGPNDTANTFEIGQKRFFLLLVFSFYRFEIEKFLPESTIKILSESITKDYSTTIDPVLASERVSPNKATHLSHFLTWFNFFTRQGSVLWLKHLEILRNQNHPFFPAYKSLLTALDLNIHLVQILSAIKQIGTLEQQTQVEFSGPITITLPADNVRLSLAEKLTFRFENNTIQAITGITGLYKNAVAKVKFNIAAIEIKNDSDELEVYTKEIQGNALGLIPIKLFLPLFRKRLTSNIDLASDVETRMLIRSPAFFALKTVEIHGDQRRLYIQDNPILQLLTTSSYYITIKNSGHFRQRRLYFGALESITPTAEPGEYFLDLNRLAVPIKHLKNNDEKLAITMEVSRTYKTETVITKYQKRP